MKTFSGYSFGLSDGSKWNLRKLTRYSSEWPLYSEDLTSESDPTKNEPRNRLRDRARIRPREKGGPHKDEDPNQTLEG